MNSYCSDSLGETPENRELSSTSRGAVGAAPWMLLLTFSELEKGRAADAGGFRVDAERGAGLGEPAGHHGRVIETGIGVLDVGGGGREVGARQVAVHRDRAVGEVVDRRLADLVGAAAAAVEGGVLGVARVQALAG